ADAGHRPGPHGAAQADAARRAVDGPGPDARPGDLRDREPPEPRRGRIAAARRAERDHRAPLRAVRLRDGERTDRAGRRREDDQRERGYQGVLPGPDRGGAAQVLSRREALPAAEAVAVVSATRGGAAAHGAAGRGAAGRGPAAAARPCSTTQIDDAWAPVSGHRFPAGTDAIPETRVSQG